VAVHFTYDDKYVRIHNIKGPCEFAGFRSRVADVSFRWDMT